MNLELERISKEYIKGWPVLDSVSFTISNESVCLMGIRGEGKSSLIRIILGLDKKFSGEVKYDGVSVRNLSQKELNALLIEERLILKMRKTVSQNVAFGLRLRKMENEEQRVENALKKCGIFEIRDKTVKHLQFEQQFMVSLARGLARSPRLIILDDVFVKFEEQEGIKLMAKTLEILKDVDAVKIFATESLELGNSMNIKKIIL